MPAPALYHESLGPPRTDVNDAVLKWPPALVNPGDIFYERCIVDEQEKFGLTLEKAQYTTRRVTGLSCPEETAPDADWIDTDSHDDHFYLKFAERLPVPARDYLQRAWGPDPSITTFAPPGTSLTQAPFETKGSQTATQWELPKETPPELADISEYIFQHLEGEHARSIVNQFLIGWQDRQAQHSEGGLHNHKYLFAVTADGYLYSVIIVGPGSGKDSNDSWYLRRMCHHPSRHPNTSSWFISRVVGWLRQHDDDRDQLVALAGIDGNYGWAYDIAGFELESVTEVDHTLTSEKHDYDSQGSWTKRRWIRAL